MTADYQWSDVSCDAVGRLARRGVQVRPQPGRARRDRRVRLVLRHRARRCTAQRPGCRRATPAIAQHQRELRRPRTRQATSTTRSRRFSGSTGHDAGDYSAGAGRLQRGQRRERRRLLVQPVAARRASGSRPRARRTTPCSACSTAAPTRSAAPAVPPTNEVQSIGVRRRHARQPHLRADRQHRDDGRRHRPHADRLQLQRLRARRGVQVPPERRRPTCRSTPSARAATACISLHNQLIDAEHHLRHRHQHQRGLRTRRLDLGVLNAREVRILGALDRVHGRRLRLGRPRDVSCSDSDSARDAAYSFSLATDDAGAHRPGRLELRHRRCRCTARRRPTARPRWRCNTNDDAGHRDRRRRRSTTRASSMTGCTGADEPQLLHRLHAPTRRRGTRCSSSRSPRRPTCRSTPRAPASTP